MTVYALNPGFCFGAANPGFVSARRVSPDVLADFAVAHVDTKLRRVGVEVLVRVHGREVRAYPARVAVKRAAPAREEQRRVELFNHPRRGLVDGQNDRPTIFVPTFV